MIHGSLLSPWNGLRGAVRDGSENFELERGLCLTLVGKRGIIGRLLLFIARPSRGLCVAQWVFFPQGLSSGREPCDARSLRARHRGVSGSCPIIVSLVQEFWDK